MRTRMRCSVVAGELALVAMVVAATGGAAGAQVVRGEVREVGSRAPIAGAQVVIRDSARVVAAFTQTDEFGEFDLRVPVNAYSIRVVRVGFAPESVSTAGCDALDTTNVVLEMRAIFMPLTPVVIETERRGIRDMDVLGMHLKTMSTHIITPSEIETASRGARTYLDVIRTALPAGVTVSERGHCVGTDRGVEFSGQMACAMVFVDGNRLDDPAMALERVQPLWLDHAIFVRAADAGMRFGTGAAGGVLLLFTKFGGYALERN